MAYARRDIRGGAVATTLGGAITGTPATFTIASSTGWPDGSAGSFLVAVDRPIDGQTNAAFEKILCTSRSGTTVTVGTRGYDGSASTDHASGARVEHIVGAVDVDEANYWVAELSGASSAGAGRLVVSDGANSLAGVDGSTSGRILIGNGTTIASVAVSGDATLSSAGALTVANSAITDAKVAAANKDGAAGTASMRTLGAGATQAMAGNATPGGAPTGAAGGSLAGTYPNPTIGASTVGASQITDGTVGIAELAAAAKTQFQTFFWPGTLTTGAGVMRLRFPVAATILHTRLAVNTAPTGAAILVDINKNGTTLYTTQGNRPTIAISANAETATTAPDVTSMSAGDYLTADIDQIGSTVAGSNLTATIAYTLA